MGIQISATAGTILIATVLTGVFIFRWSQKRTREGVPQEAGDWAAAITVAVAVGALLAALASLPDDNGCAEDAPLAVTTEQCPRPSDTGTPSPSGSS
ncbi:hypothetical protein [Streptomyces bobili]|uniref:Uncharacterized protein n=1 Tax=Streptomyces bobili TaxID=67280 RepID=A0ABZ1R590_9ACTN|nr:hypothetical protein [Streptomyces bobili]